MSFSDYIEPGLLLVVPVLWFIGWIIKEKTKINDAWIPFILSGVGILLCGCYLFSTQPFSDAREIFELIFSVLTQGLLCAAGSVFGNQVIKQAGILVNNSSDKDEGGQ